MLRRNVQQDIEMAQNVGVQGVPFFVSTINMLFLAQHAENLREKH
jgi:predicted DsbA family dithiol-disulfide isomerase